MKYFALVMSTLYIVAGLLLLFTHAMSERIATLRIPLGLVLVLYGAMRGWMWWRKYGSSGKQGA